MGLRRKVALEVISQFACSMAACLMAGLPPKKSLEVSAGKASCRVLERAASLAARAVDQGRTISEGFEANRRRLPAFVLPVIQAGEMGGRQIEAYQLVHEHCERLKPALTLLRQAWLYPLICIVSGWVIRTGIFLYFGMNHAALIFVRETFLASALFAGLCWGLLQAPFIRNGLDWFLLQIPFVRTTQIRVDLMLFFAVFRLAYEAGGLSVLPMFDLALQAVRNQAIHKDLLTARRVLEENGAFEDAFAEPETIEDQLKGLITAGAVSGHLGTSLGQIVKYETAALEISLDLFNRIVQRLVGLTVAFSIVETLLVCLFYSPRS
jgi:type II secretory pathway component PulF